MIEEQAKDLIIEESKELSQPKNVVTKFAFATRVGYIPNNPAKVNQDNFILQPNI